MKDFFFDYIYYRFQKFYRRWDGENGITSVIGVSMIQAVVFFDVFLFILKLFYTRSETQEYSKVFGYSGVMILILLIIFNHYRFKDRYDSFEEKWKNEPLKFKVLKGIAVIFSILAPWIIIILIGSQ